MSQRPQATHPLPDPSSADVLEHPYIGPGVGGVGLLLRRAQPGSLWRGGRKRRHPQYGTLRENNKWRFLYFCATHWLVGSGEPCFQGRPIRFSRILMPSPFFPLQGYVPRPFISISSSPLPKGDSIQVLPAVSFWKRERYRLSYRGYSLCVNVYGVVIFVLTIIKVGQYIHKVRRSAKV